jgi:hypothetical protein
MGLATYMNKAADPTLVEIPHVLKVEHHATTTFEVNLDTIGTKHLIIYICISSTDEIATV